MKEEEKMSGNSFWLFMVLGVLIVATTFVFACCKLNTNYNEKMASMGYCKTTLQGTYELVWAKCSNTVEAK